MICPNCGETCSGDGYTMVTHCPDAYIDDYWYSEPDATPVYCKPKEKDN